MFDFVRIGTLVIGLVIAGCPQRPGPEPFAPDGIEESCSSACMNLRRIGCPEGSASISGAPCERTCLIASELRNLPLTCWIRAESIGEARGCGSLRCVR